LIRCSFCGEKIDLVSLNKSIKITLGNLINGKFCGSKSLFYHKDCLVNDECHKEQHLAQLI